MDIWDGSKSVHLVVTQGGFMIWCFKRTETGLLGPWAYMGGNGELMSLFIWGHMAVKFSK